MIVARPKHILTDTDGCLVNWNAGFREFMSGKDYPQVADTDGYYSIASRYGITSEEARLHIREFNESERIAYLRPFADAQEYVGKLANLGFRFTVVTSLSSHPQAKIRRTANLFNLFGDVFEEIVCLNMGANKYNELTRWQDSGLFWIEDHPEQAEAGYRAGLKPLLINHPYSAEYKTEAFPFVSLANPWKDIYETACKEYGVNE
jgi:hypothetical protein